MISCRRLHWLGHVARMNDDHLPKQLLFGWLPQRRPPHGAKLHWRNKVRRDLKTFHIDGMYWHEIDRSGAGCVKEVHLSVVQLKVVDFIVTDVNTVLVDPKIKPDTVVPVSAHNLHRQ